MTFRQGIYCSVCVDTYDIVRYNPYFNNYPSNDNNNRVYDNDVTDFTDIFDNVSKVLEDCRQYAYSEINSLFTNISIPTSSCNSSDNISSSNEIFSHLFFNIDGNDSNFDEFLCNISSIDNKFSAIGIAKTNT